jgi:hypothetical protein
MLNIDRGFETLGVYCFPAPGEDLRIFYLPLAADCQRGADGRPQAHLLVAGETAFLQVATVWDVPGDRLEQIRQAVAARLGAAEPALVRLAYAPVVVEAVQLVSADAGRDERELATSRGSGLPPHSAMFNLPLQGEDRGRATSAFAGHQGFLLVRYRASLTVPVRHEARLSGDIADVSDVAALEAALAEGRATLAFDPADEGLRDAYIARAVELLGLMAPEPGAATELLIELATEERLDIAVATDVGSWFEGAAPGVTPVPGPGFEPRPEPPAPEPGLAVSLDLPGAEEVVSGIEVATPAALARLVPPGFAPISLPRPDEAAVRVRTSFVEDGGDFEADVPAPADGPLVLAASDLGIIEVTIDAGPLAERGLDKLRTTLRYRPEGPGGRRERTFYLREPPWAARWLVVSRGEPLGSSLTYEFRATLASGETVAQGPVAALSPAITLTANLEE